MMDVTNSKTCKNFASVNGALGLLIKQSCRAINTESVNLSCSFALVADNDLQIHVMIYCTKYKQASLNWILPKKLFF